MSVLRKTQGTKKNTAVHQANIKRTRNTCGRRDNKNKFLVGMFRKDKFMVHVGKLLHILLRALEMKQIFP
jgi:hypothetical protein